MILSNVLDGISSSPRSYKAEVVESVERTYDRVKTMFRALQDFLVIPPGTESEAYSAYLQSLHVSQSGEGSEDVFTFARSTLTAEASVKRKKQVPGYQNPFSTRR